MSTQFSCTACGTALPNPPLPFCPGCGRRMIFPSARVPAKNHILTQRVPTLVTCSVLGAILVGTCFASIYSSAASRPVESEDRSVGAWVACQEFVEQRLLSPGSAKFPLDYRPLVSLQVQVVIGPWLTWMRKTHLGRCCAAGLSVMCMRRANVGSSITSYSTGRRNVAE